MATASLQTSDTDMISGSVCLVNARTGEGAWTGVRQPVCFHFPFMCLSIAHRNCNLACSLFQCGLIVQTKHSGAKFIMPATALQQ